MGKNGFRKVLVLNATHMPINICGWKRAMKLIFKGKALVLRGSGAMINEKYVLPLVVRLQNYIPRPYREIVLNRKNIYLRDNHTCQYCGKNGNLTIDHVIPKSRGGVDSWSNIVACCIRCNNRKGDKLLEEAGMKLKRSPYKPPSALYLHMTRLSYVPECWTEYFFSKS